MEVQTILWPTDLSRNSLKAAPQVVSWLKNIKPKLF